MHTLTHEELESLSHTLSREEARIRDQVGAALATPDARQEEAQDELDLADQCTSEQTHDALLEHNLAKLADIASARERIAQNIYGICADCGEYLPFLRLLAYPTAKRCTPCQEQYEQQRAQGHG